MEMETKKRITRLGRQGEKHGRERLMMHVEVVQRTFITLAKGNWSNLEKIARSGARLLCITCVHVIDKDNGRVLVPPMQGSSIKQSVKDLVIVVNIALNNKVGHLPTNLGLLGCPNMECYYHI
jgi:hypothetical protein